MTIPFNIPFPGIVAVAVRKEDGKIELYGMERREYDSIFVVKACEHLLFDFEVSSSCAKIWVASAVENEVKHELGYEFFGEVQPIKDSIHMIYGYFCGACAHSDRNDLIEEMFGIMVNSILRIIDTFPEIKRRRIYTIERND